MSRIGARAKRERLNTSWYGKTSTYSKKPKVWSRTYNEEEVKIACEWTLVFMLMFRDPKARHGAWYEMTTTHSCRFPMGSYRYIFFWSLRFLGEKAGLDGFREYLAWKLAQFTDGHVRREGPVW